MSTAHLRAEQVVAQGGADTRVPVGGEVRIPFVLTAQACDDKICLQPSEIAVVARITVE